MKHLRYSLYGCPPDDKHPQTVMRDFGIVYDEAIPQTIGDQWWFLNCRNIPAILPKYITEMEISLETCRQYQLPDSFANDKSDDRITSLESQLASALEALESVTLSAKVITLGSTHVTIRVPNETMQKAREILNKGNS